MEFIIRPKQAKDTAEINALMIESWHTAEIITRGRLYVTAELDMFVAESGKKLIGLAAYRFDGNECEIVVLQSNKEKQGIGTRLVNEVIKTAQNKGCRRLWLITTNDNLSAMRFYQRLGFSFSALYRNAMEVSRRIKPQIPLVGKDNIPLKDEIEFEIMLN